MNEHDLDWNFSWNINKIREATDEIESKAKQYGEKMAAALEVLPVREIKPIGFDRFNVRQWKTPQEARRRIDAAYLEAQKVYESNKDAIEANERTFSGIMAVLDRAGIPKTYYGYPSSRHRKRQQIGYKWPTEISTLIPRHQHDPKPIYEQYVKDIEKWEKEIADKEAEQQRKREQEQRRKENEQALGFLAAKYGCEIGAIAEDVLDKILSRNKYLRLAWFLERNRFDWSDGPYYAQCGLNGFTAETERDKEIVAELSSHICKWEGDGRVFRDCKWSYGAIYALVDDAMLFTDFNKVVAMMIE